MTFLNKKSLKRIFFSFSIVVSFFGISHNSTVLAGEIYTYQTPSSEKSIFSNRASCQKSMYDNALARAVNLAPDFKNLLQSKSNLYLENTSISEKNGCKKESDSYHFFPVSNQLSTTSFSDKKSCEKEAFDVLKHGSSYKPLLLSLTSTQVSTLNVCATLKTGSNGSNQNNQGIQNQNTPYTFLAPFEAFGISPTFDPKAGFGEYITLLFQIMISIAGIAAIVMISYGGILYMGSESLFAKNEGKQYIQNAGIGLVFLFGVFLVLKWVAPGILRISTENIKEARITIQEVSDESDIDKPAYTGKVKIPNKRDKGSFSNEAEKRASVEAINQVSLINIREKGVVLSNSSIGSYLDKSFGEKIINAFKELTKENTGARVTEAFKPSTYRHIATCHYKATCIDLSTDNKSPDNIKKIYTILQKYGVAAVWEVQSKNDTTGLDGINILVLGGHITGSHFSVYDTK